jgi:hypothetical protein
MKYLLYERLPGFMSVLWNGDFPQFLQLGALKIITKTNAKQIHGSFSPFANSSGAPIITTIRIAPIAKQAIAQDRARS